ncbi:MAG: hypothetical protein ACYS3N_08505 [Planctomycetota bacterium]
MNTRCPVVDTQCPEGPTKCPVVETQCPVDPTFCPIDPTQQCQQETIFPQEPTICPVVQTQCPRFVLTWCPSESTQCPPDQTVCPPPSPTGSCEPGPPWPFGTGLMTRYYPVTAECPAIDVQAPTVVPQLLLAKSP